MEEQCPVCGDDSDIGFNDEDQFYECGSCGCAFGEDGEIIDDWTTCIDCGTYVAPEDKVYKDTPVCQECIS